MKSYHQKMFDEIIKSLTHAIKEAMRHRDYSKTELAYVLKVHPSFITKILKGKHNFTIKTLCKIADALNRNIRIEIL